jgi:queuosine precursor transporter
MIVEQPKPAPRVYRYFDLVMALFVTILVTSNVASSAKIIDWGFSIFSVRMAFDGGTILFPISYIFSDVLTEVYGYAKARRVVWAGFICLALASLTFFFVRILPGEATWQGYAGQGAYDAILGGMSTGGIVLASLAGYWLGNFSNNFILAKMKVLTKGRFLWMRTIGSTLVGELFDSVTFILIATLFGVFPWSLFITLALTNYIFKCSIEALMTPVTYQVVRFLKRAENEDYYDKGTNFTPFKIQE